MTPRGDDVPAVDEVTLGEVNRNVNALRADLQTYIRDHRAEHTRDNGTTRWQVTTVISLAGLLLAVLAAVATSSPPL